MVDEQTLRYVADLAEGATTGEHLMSGENPLGIVRWLTPEGYKSELVNLEQYEAHPRMKRGLATLRDLDSFISYLVIHGDSGTAVYRDGKAFRAIIDGHSAETAGWGHHVAEFQPKWTPGWTAWTGFNSHWLSQDDFANFLSDRIPEIAEPAGAVVHEAVMNLRLHWEATYERAIQPSNDFVQLRYTEEAKGGEFKVPAQFTLCVTPFDGAEPVTVGARLRFAKPDEKGRVRFQYILGEEAQQALDAEFARMEERIAGEASVPVFRGSFMSPGH